MNGVDHSAVMLPCESSFLVASQPRCPGATAETTVKAGEEIAARLSNAGFSAIELETLRLDPAAVCVIGQNEIDESGL